MSTYFVFISYLIHLILKLPENHVKHVIFYEYKRVIIPKLMHDNIVSVYGDVITNIRTHQG